MAYSIVWKLWDVQLEDRHLVHWQTDVVRKTARELVKGIEPSVPSQKGELRGLLAQELRDWVLRGGERFLPLPDVTLDLYWKAHRGLPGFYDPLLLGLDSTKYLGAGSAGDIGEGLALAVLETRNGGLGQVAFCRPLGTAPDFLCCDPSKPQVRPIVEVKATEKGKIQGLLADAVHSLLDIYRGWQRHRPLCLTPGYAVAVKLAPDAFEVSIIRLLFQGKELVDPQMDAPLNVRVLIDARKLLWAGANEEAVEALAIALAGRRAQEMELELAPLLDLQGAAAAATALEEDGPQDEPELSEAKKGATHHREFLKRLEHPKARARAEALLKSVEKNRKSEEQAPGPEPRRREGKRPINTPWLTIVRERADGLEVRGCLRGDRRLEATQLPAVAHVVLQKAFRRLETGFDAVACWLDDVEWTLFGDGRVQGWLPATQNIDRDGARLRDEANAMLRQWDLLIRERR